MSFCFVRIPRKITYISSSAELLGTGDEVKPGEALRRIGFGNEYDQEGVFSYLLSFLPENLVLSLSRHLAAI